MRKLFIEGDKMEDKEIERKEMLKKSGYLTVDNLIEKLKLLQESGHGDELVGSDFEHYQYCEYDKTMKYVIIC